MNISSILFENADAKYANFQRKLIPNIDPNSIIGVRTPVLRKIAKEIIKVEIRCKEKFFDDRCVIDNINDERGDAESDKD